MAITRALLVSLCALLCAPFAVASTLTIPQNDLYPYQNSIILQEDFVSGNATTASIGVLGFGATNGTTSFIAASSVNRPGILRRDTSAVINTVASLVLSALASFLPAWHASRSSVREALGFE